MMSLTFLLRALLPTAHQMSACVSRRTLAPTISVLAAPTGRRGLEEGLFGGDEPLRGAGPPLWLTIVERNESGVGFAAFGDDDLFARVCPVEQTREVGLRFVDVHRLLH